MIKIKLTLDVINDLRNLANSIETLVGAMENIETTSSETKEIPKKKKIKKSEEPKQPEAKEPTLEEVRAAMAEKNREGHREKIKAIIVNHGANKLTSLDPVHFSEILKEVEAIK